MSSFSRVLETDDSPTCACCRAAHVPAISPQSSLTPAGNFAQTGSSPPHQQHRLTTGPDFEQLLYLQQTNKITVTNHTKFMPLLVQTELS